MARHLLGCAGDGADRGRRGAVRRGGLSHARPQRPRRCVARGLRERETGLHSKRVATHTLLLAAHHYTDVKDLREVYWGSLLHDIDTLDAMTVDHPYRKALPFDTAKTEIQRMACSQFDPLAVDTFLAEEAALREMIALEFPPTR